MKQKKVWRYYCDFCGKSGCAAGHMKKHEKHCTANPNRSCRMCKATSRDYTELSYQVWKARSVDPIRSEVENCPACLLTAIRLGMPKHLDQDDNPFNFPSIDFKKESEEWFNNINSLRLEEEQERNRMAYNCGALS